MAHAQCNAVIGSVSNPIFGCGPLTVVLDSDSSTGTITGYSWDFGDGSPLESIQNPSHTFAMGAADSTYIVTLSITCSTAPGSHDTSITVVVYAPPAVLFFIDTAATCDFSDTVCFDNQSETGVGYTYNWNFGDLSTCSPSCFEPCHTYATDGLYNVLLTVTDDNFCQDSLTVVVNTNFSLLPVVALGSSVLNDTICIGDSIVFTASASGYLVQPITYVFIIDTTVQSGLNSAFGTTGLADGDSVVVLLINANGCVSDTSNTLVTTILPLPVISLIGSDSILCGGDSIVFTASPSGLDTYLFYDDTTLLQNSSSDIYATDSLKAGNILFAIGINSDGCISQASDTLSITVNPTPSPSLSSNIIGIGICVGDSVALTVTDTAVSGAAYLWNTADTIDTITKSPALTTAYSVTATLNGCTGTDSLVIIVDTVQPTANAGDDVALCEGESVDLSAGGGVVYSWSPATGLSCTNCQNPMANPISTITYQVTVTNIACFDTDEVTVTIAACSIGAIPQVITPNEDGANDILQIINIGNYPDNQLKIFNRWGNIVVEIAGYNNVSNYWDGKSNNGAKLPDGTYYYLLDLGDENEPLTGYVVILR